MKKPRISVEDKEGDGRNDSIQIEDEKKAGLIDSVDHFLDALISEDSSDDSQQNIQAKGHYNHM